MKKKIKINDIKQAVKEGIMKELETIKEEYEQALPKYEMPEYEEYDGEDAIIFGDTISDEQYALFDEQMEDVFIDINNIFSNVNDIKHNINYDFPNKFELKEEIFSLLKEIEEKTDTMAEKIMNLVNYMGQNENNQL